MEVCYSIATHFEVAGMLIYLLSIFLSAFLLFQIQPMIARFILPWFGGTPAVWSTVLLFFQMLLTGGYAYAYGLIGRVRADRQGRVHLILLVGSLIGLLSLGLVWPSPITPGAEWKPASVDWPLLRIFIILALSVGLPYFTLATNSPLMQAWFNRALPGQSPYWLYALSNIGSLLALVSYPFLIEPWLSLREQGWVWSAGYGLFVGLTAIGAWRSRQGAAAALPQASAATPRPAPRLQLLWIGLSAIASALLLAVTSQMTQEVAAIPFLWILPLVVYLLSFVLTFSGEHWYHRPTFSLLLAGASIGLGWIILTPLADIVWQLACYTFFLWVACMVAHGELYRLRPAPAHLTRFYLMTSVGGALGGLIVNLIAPYIFSGYWELYIGWAILTLLLAGLTFIRPTELRPRWRFAHDAAVGALAVIVCLFAGFTVFTLAGGDLARGRNFYGVVRVRVDPVHNTYAMVHGVTLHGSQFMDPEKRSQPIGYHWPGGGIGLALQHHPRAGHGLRVGVLGLGVGVLAAYGQPGDVYRFYEINPLVVELAEGQGNYFSFLSDSPADISVALGDARLVLEQELAAGQPQQFDVLALDAFSSDSIPIHLLTREAFDVYLAHLAPGGVIAAHISNRHVDLQPVLRQMAEHFELEAAVLYIPASETEPATSTSLWVLLTRDAAFLAQPAIAAHAQSLDTAPVARLWTDDYSNLVQMLK